ncbi:MAG: single-stranded-DNA-specific exonuclease RecJ [Alphaproteobacteria bacterium]|nr:single-stranded-DNA-specific exonuclease RecJ [Alphaproteobacteria bacterium]
MEGGSPAAPALLGIERSLAGRRWELRLPDDRLALAIAQAHGIPEPVARVLAGRGVAPDDAPRFLAPRLRDLLPDPSSFLDMDVAATRLADAVTRGEAIAIFGDYDVDGATSAAVLRSVLSAVGGSVRVYIPDRLREGYGPNAPALRALAADGVRVVVTVDCGTLAFEALAAAREAGLETIVVDHHAAEPRLPAAIAVINPNRLDETAGHGYLAAVGVAFLLAVAVVRALRRRDWFAARPEPDLMAELDVVALGTVCDVVPLHGLNRAFVRQGLAVMARRARPGLSALADVAKMNEAPGPYHLGFVLGPRVNAGGRVGEADLGVRLLTTADTLEARSLAARLDALNRERQEIEQAVLAEAIAQIEGEGIGDGFVLAAGEGWHPGVIGIVAARLAERFQAPSAVVAIDGGRGKGSGRSVPGFDLGAAVIAARLEGLLVDGGGHRQAAGFTVTREKLPELRSFLSTRLAQTWRRARAALVLDGVISARGANADLVEMLERAGPYGAGHPSPSFVVTDVRVAHADVVGKGHVRAALIDPTGARLQAIAFRAAESPLGTALLDRSGTTLHVAGSLRVDTWNGARRVQFDVRDAAPAMQD